MPRNTQKCMPLTYFIPKLSFLGVGYHEVCDFLFPYPTGGNARRTTTDYNGRHPIACIPNFMYPHVSTLIFMNIQIYHNYFVV